MGSGGQECEAQVLPADCGWSATLQSVSNDSGLCGLATMLGAPETSRTGSVRPVAQWSEPTALPNAVLAAAMWGSQQAAAGSQQAAAGSQQAAAGPQQAAAELQLAMFLISMSLTLCHIT